MAYKIPATCHILEQFERFSDLQKLELCYTFNMVLDKLRQNQAQTGSVWAHFLQQRGLSNLAAGILEAGGPLILIAAQLVYIGQPLLRHTIPDHDLSDLAAILEDGQKTRDFIRILREGAPQ